MMSRTGHSLRFLQIFLLLVFFASGVAFGEEGTGTGTGTGNSQKCDMKEFRDALAARESSGNYGSVNGNGYTGRYQFGEEAMMTIGAYTCAGSCPAVNQTWNGTFNGSLGVSSIEEFRNNPAAQDRAFDLLVQSNQRTINNGRLSSFIGTTYNGVTVTESGLAAACHLRGCGRTLACLEGRDTRCSDGNGTNISEYMQKFGNYNLNGGDGDGCSKYAQDSSPRSQTGGNPMCAENIRANVSAQVNASVAKYNDFFRTNFTPPPPLAQMANQPCMSKELQRISNQFAYAPSRYSQQLTGGLLSAGGPVSGIMQNLFKSEFSSINSAASSIPKMLNFQSMASSVMGDLLGSLGLGDAFSSQLCGLMVDMVLKYIQCENPIKLPSLGNLFGSLNNLLPNNCAGQALKSTLMGAGNMSALKTLNQPITGSNGSYRMGDPTAIDRARGITGP